MYYILRMTEDRKSIHLLQFAQFSRKVNSFSTAFIFQFLHIGSDLDNCLDSAFNWWFPFAPEFQCCYFCESSSCLFYLISFFLFLCF